MKKYIKKWLPIVDLICPDKDEKFRHFMCEYAEHHSSVIDLTMNGRDLLALSLRVLSKINIDHLNYYIIKDDEYFDVLKHEVEFDIIEARKHESYENVIIEENIVILNNRLKNATSFGVKMMISKLEPLNNKLVLLNSVKID